MGENQYKVQIMYKYVSCDCIIFSPIAVKFLN